MMSDSRSKGNKNNFHSIWCKTINSFQKSYHGARGILLLDHPLLLWVVILYCNMKVSKGMSANTVYFCFSFSALAWLAGVVSLNDLRVSANLPRDNFKTTVAGDGKINK